MKPANESICMCKHAQNTEKTEGKLFIAGILRYFTSRFSVLMKKKLKITSPVMKILVYFDSVQRWLCNGYAC